MVLIPHQPLERVISSCCGFQSHLAYLHFILSTIYTSTAAEIEEDVWYLFLCVVLPLQSQPPGTQRHLTAIRTRGKMHENKHSCLERRLPGFCQMLRAPNPLMFCKCRCCRAKHLKLGEEQQENTQETMRTRSFGQSVEEENTKGSFNMADVVTVAVEGQLATHPC